MTELDELNKAVGIIEWYCSKCGARLTNPTMSASGFHRLGGSPEYHGYFNCPNTRWYTIGHTRLYIQYVGGNLDVFEGDEHYMHLYLHELLEGKGYW